MALQPYLYFNGVCEAAIEFYKKALGAKVNMLMRFKDAPESCAESMAKGHGDKVMHANLTISGTEVLVSDGRCEGSAKFDGFCLSIHVKTDADAERLFMGLAEGGKINTPLTKTFFSSNFGMVNDRFGVPWMVLVR